jgi:hypothetical protein
LAGANPFDLAFLPAWPIEGSAESTVKAAKLMEWVKREIETRGPLSSLDLEEETRVEWWLSGNTRAVRIALKFSRRARDNYRSAPRLHRLTATCAYGRWLPFSCNDMPER